MRTLWSTMNGPFALYAFEHIFSRPIHLNVHIELDLVMVGGGGGVLAPSMTS